MEPGSQGCRGEKCAILINSCRMMPGRVGPVRRAGQWPHIATNEFSRGEAAQNLGPNRRCESVAWPINYNSTQWPDTRQKFGELRHWGFMAAKHMSNGMSHGLADECQPVKLSLFMAQGLKD